MSQKVVKLKILEKAQYKLNYPKLKKRCNYFFFKYAISRTNFVISRRCSSDLRYNTNTIKKSTNTLKYTIKFTAEPIPSVSSINPRSDGKRTNKRTIPYTAIKKTSTSKGILTDDLNTKRKYPSTITLKTTKNNVTKSIPNNSLSHI